MGKKDKQPAKRTTLLKVFPFLGWIGELKKTKVLKADVTAGITVALILVPQSMAYAKLAELPLTVGLYTAFIPVIIAGLFGSSRQMSTGPVTIVSLMTATALAPIAISGTAGYIVYASLLALFIGIFYIILGLIRGGIIVEFLSHPVITGFTNAVALITIISQLPKVFGVVKPENSGHYFTYIYKLLLTIFDSPHVITLTIGLGSIGFLLLLKKYFPKIPRILVLLIGSIGLTYFLFHLKDFTGISLLEKDIAGLKIVGDIKGGFPDFSLPFMQEAILTGSIQENLKVIYHLGVYAIIIGLIGFTESFSVAKFIGTQTKQRIGANRELIGQGLANISSGVFGGMGVAGSFSKTAVNLKSGARTGFSSIVTGVIVGITILYLTPLLYYLPIATLSAIIIIAVIDLIKIQPIITAWKMEKHDGIVGIFTFILTFSLTPSIEKGILFGVVLSLVFYIYRSMKPKFVELAMYKDGVYRDFTAFGLKTSKHVSVYRFDGSLYFANAGHFESKLLQAISHKKDIKYIVIDMEWIPNIDSSGLEVLKDLISDLGEGGVTVYLTSIRVQVLRKLIKAGFLKEFGKKNIFRKIEDAINHIDKKDGDKTKTKSLEEYSPDKDYDENKKIGKYIIKRYMKD